MQIFIPHHLKSFPKPPWDFELQKLWKFGNLVCRKGQMSKFVMGMDLRGNSIFLFTAGSRGMNSQMNMSTVTPFIQNFGE